MRNNKERNFVVIAIITVCALSTALWFAGVTSHAALPGHKTKSAGAEKASIPTSLSEADEATRQRTNEDYGKIPLGFEVNQGQTDAQVQFLSRGAGYTIFLTPQAAVLSLQHPGDQSRKRDAAATNRPANVLRMSLVGANPQAKATGADPLPGTSNYFIGNDPTKWRVDVPSYSKVSYREVYKGVDLVYYGNQRQLENDFVVAPGVDPDIIAVTFEGAHEVTIGKGGDLLLQTASGQVQLQKPVIYQHINGARREVAGNYVMRNKLTVGFEIADYDHTAPLVIDPVLVYSFPLIGNLADSGNSIAVDASGNAYITGDTTSSVFPTATAMDTTLGGGRDAFVAKINPSGTALVYSTYLGGNNVDYGFDLAIDAAGNAFITGRTSSTDFPTVNAFDSAVTPSNEDAFVARLNPAGSALVYSTYLSGQFGSRGWGIATDGSGNAYVTGVTGVNHPVTANAFNSTNFNSGFLAKLNTNGSGASSLLYSTFLSNTGTGEGRAIAADATGNVYITGSLFANSTNFATPGAFQTTYGGGSQDAFVEKFNTNLSGAASRVYATYLGGSGADFGGGSGAFDPGKAIAIDAAGNAYITGKTTSTNFPTANAFQATNSGGPDGTDAFLTKLNATGTALVYSTYLGGNGTSSDEGRGVAVNVVGNAYVTGLTGSVNFPSTTPPLPLSTTGGIFITKFSPSGGAPLAYSTRLVSNPADKGHGVALDDAGNAFITGVTGSDVFLNQVADPTIIGRVVDEDGLPISSATVNLTGVPTATTTTDANGYFTFGLLTVANNYTVSVVVPNYVFASQVVNGLQKNVRLLFTPVVNSISGQVTTTGTTIPVSEVTMSLTGGKTRSTLTDVDGNYSFGNLPTGRTYTVTPSKALHSFEPVSRTFNSISVNQTANFESPPIWVPTVLAASQVEINSWTAQGTSYAYLKLSFPKDGFRVVDWGQVVRAGNDFSANASVEKWTGTSVLAVSTTAFIYDLGVLTPGSYNFAFKNSGTTVKTLAFNVGGTPQPNPIDDARFFVKQQYLDFLNRQADQGGEDFWTDNITKCNDPARRPAGQTIEQCTLRQRETTSGAFFLSPEFQYTRYFVYRLYVGGLGRRPKLSEFSPDAQIVGNGIVVNGQLSGAKIEENKAAFAAQFVNCVDAAKYRCSEFKSIYDGLSNQQYVDKLFQNTGVNASASDRAALVNGLDAATETRASVLQKIVDGVVVIAEGNQQFTTSYGQAFYNAESNRAFVQFEYFGYMKRDPDESGYAFWLGKLNSFNGDFVAAEMVLAFISSPEYRAQFGQP